MMIPLLNKSFPGGIILLALAVVVMTAIFATPGSAAGPVKVIDVAAGHGLSVALLTTARYGRGETRRQGALGTVASCQ